MTRVHGRFTTEEDRRQQPRASRRQLVASIADSSQGNRSIGARGSKRASVIDLSEEGISLEGVALPDHARVDLSIPLPSREGRVQQCRAKAQVLGHEGERVRLTLHPLLPVHMLQLRDYIWRSNLGGRSPAPSRPLDLHRKARAQANTK